MAKANNKHKAQGKKPVVIKESWWTPQRIKYAMAAAVAMIIIIIGVCIFNYVNGLQDSVVGVWSNKYTASDTGEDMEVLFTFNEDETCKFIRLRSGVEEAAMEGTYDVGDNFDIITLMLGEDGNTVLQYVYECDDGKLSMKNYNTGIVDNYVKVEE